MNDKILQLVSEIETRLDEIRDLVAEEETFETDHNFVTCSVCGNSGMIDMDAYNEAMAHPNSMVICSYCAVNAGFLKKKPRFN